MRIWRPILHIDHLSKLAQEIVAKTNKTLVGLFFSSLVPAYIYYDFVPHNYLFAWLTLQLLVLYLRFTSSEAIRKCIACSEIQDLQNALKKFTLVIALSAIWWNVMLIGGAHYAQNNFEYFSFVMTLGLITAAIISLSAIFRTYMTFFLLMIIPQLLYIATFDGYGHKAILLMSTIYIPYVFLLSKETNANLIQSIKDNLELAQHKEFLEQEVNERVKDIVALTDEIQITQKEVVYTMGAIGESRSKETANHVKRVAAYSKLLALEYGLGEEEAEMLKQASPMHDIGKVAIPDAILNKPGRLDDKEREIMNTHATLGYEMLHHSERPLLKVAADLAYGHHEKWDGSGYPNALQGEEISIYARITALADVFDALGSERCYKKAWKLEDILTLFQEESGKHFEPKLVEIFFANLDKFVAIREEFSD